MVRERIRNIFSRSDIALKKFLDTEPVTFRAWVAGFLGIIFVRIFLENFSNISLTGGWASDASTIVHYYLYYLAVTLSLLLFLGIFIERKLLEQISLFALAGNIFAPVFDLL